MPSPHDSPAPRAALREVALLFLRLGLTAFGGPAAHIALMRDEVVRRRRWLDDQTFLDMVGATNLIPGPNSTEMAIHLGHRRAGWPGLLLGGVLFILPAALIVGVLAALYVRYGTRAQAEWLLYGVKPVIIVIIIQAVLALGRRAVKGPALALIGGAALALYLLGVNELLLLAAAALAAALLRHGPRLRDMGHAVFALPLLGAPAAASAVAGFSTATLFLTFLKIGAVLYGSGYVLLAFLRADFVERLGWLTEQQLLDAIAVGQATPGPVFTTATFVGYILGGWQAAALATVAIFLPSFVFVALLAKILPLARRSPIVAALLDGVNIASLALMAGVAWQLGRAAIADWFTVLLALAAAVLLFRTRINSFWLLLAAAGAGLAARAAGV
ncbi:MAG: chromate efflux transporter [Dehalococcoidia bacterium]|nr:chromate efflux transporter [Dehalococcoidia bacterium]